MNVGSCVILCLIFAGAASSGRDIAVQETNSIRVELIQPEGGAHFRINDGVLLWVDNRLFPTNMLFLPENPEVLLDVSCVAANGKSVPRKSRYEAIGKWFNEIPAQVSPKKADYTISTGIKTMTFRSRSRDVAARPVHGRQASRELFIPNEVFDFPSGDEFLMKVRVQLIIQNGQASKFQVVKFPDFIIHLSHK